MVDAAAREQTILRERARHLAQAHKRLQSRARGQEVAIVGVGEERFGLAAAAMVSLVPTPAIAALPGLPPWMPGIVQVRGVVLSVISISTWFEVAKGGDGRYLAVVSGEQGAVGLLVDAVLGFRELHPGDMATDFAPATDSKRPVYAVTTDLIALIDVGAVLERAQLGARRGQLGAPTPRPVGERSP